MAPIISKPVAMVLEAAVWTSLTNKKKPLIRNGLKTG